MEETSDKKKPSAFRSEEVIAGTAIVLFSLTIFLQVPGSYGNVMLFPAIVGTVSLVCGLFLALTGFLRPSPRAAEPFTREWIGAGISAFIFLAMSAAENLGFYSCLLIVCFAINRLIAVFCGERGGRKTASSLLLSVLMTGAVYLVFGVLLGIVTPAGVLI